MTFSRTLRKMESKRRDQRRFDIVPNFYFPDSLSLCRSGIFCCGGEGARASRCEAEEWESTANAAAVDSHSDRARSPTASPIGNTPEAHDSDSVFA